LLRNTGNKVVGATHAGRVWPWHPSFLLLHNNDHKIAAGPATRFFPNMRNLCNTNALGHLPNFRRVFASQGATIRPWGVWPKSRKLLTRLNLEKIAESKIGRILVG